MSLLPALRRGAPFFAALILTEPALADVIVGTTQELKTAIEEVDEGEIIKLKPGRYENVFLRGVKGAEGQPITITSADLSDPAQFGNMRLHETSHIVLDGLVFDYIFSPGDKLHLRSFQITNSKDITVRNSLFDGDVAQGVSESSDGFAYTFGLDVRQVDGLVVEENEIRTFYRGLKISNSRNILVRENDLHSLRMDGMNFSQVSNVLIEENYIHDFDRSPDSNDHADMIQFWTNQTEEPTTNVTIRSNLLNSEDGLYTQSIFMRNEEVDKGRSGKEMFYRDLVIEDNIIINAHLHGIAIGESDGVRIENNSLIRNPRSEGERDNAPLYNPRISVSSKSNDVKIIKNVVSRISGYERQKDWEANENYLIQDQHQLQPGYYGNVFANALKGDPKNLSSFFYKKNGPLHGAKYGAPRLSRP